MKLTEIIEEKGIDIKKGTPAKSNSPRRRYFWDQEDESTPSRNDASPPQTEVSAVAEVPDETGIFSRESLENLQRVSRDKEDLSDFSRELIFPAKSGHSVKHIVSSWQFRNSPATDFLVLSASDTDYKTLRSTQIFFSAPLLSS